MINKRLVWKYINTILLVAILFVVIFPYTRNIPTKIRIFVDTKIEERKQKEINNYLTDISERKKQKAEKILSDNNILSLTVGGEISDDVLNYLKSQKLVTSEKVDCTRPKEQYDLECTTNRFGCEHRPSSVLTNRIEACANLKNDAHYKLFIKELDKIREISSKGNIERDPDLFQFFGKLKDSLLYFDQEYK